MTPRARVDLSAEGTDKVGRRMKSGREKCVWDKDNVGRIERSVCGIERKERGVCRGRRKVHSHRAGSGLT